MYDSMITRFNLDTNGGRGVECGSGQIKRGTDLGGNMWPRFRESVDSVLTYGKFPHR